MCLKKGHHTPQSTGKMSCLKQGKVDHMAMDETIVTSSSSKGGLGRGTCVTDAMEGNKVKVSALHRLKS